MSECLRVVGSLGTLFGGILEKIGARGKGENSKTAVVAVKRRRRVCVRGVRWKRGGGCWGRDYHWRHLKNLEV